MEKILIISAPDGKAIAQKISKSLKDNGYSNTLGASRVDQDPILPELVIAVISNDAILNPQMVRLMDGCSEKGVSVVPFVTTRLGNSITSNFFLDEHVWIDNVECTYEQSEGDLIDCIKNNYSEITRKPVKKHEQDRLARNGKKQAQQTKTGAGASKNTSASEKEKLYKNMLWLAGAVIVILLFLLVNGGLEQTNRDAMNQKVNSMNINGNTNYQIQLSSDLKNSESALVGRWKMVDYYDNQFRPTHSDSLAFQSLIDALVSRAQLVFGSNKSFQRMGFSENTETGTWEYDPQSKYLKLQPTGVNQYDVVQLQEVNETKMVIVVSEQVEGNPIMTRMTFQKIGNN